MEIQLFLIETMEIKIRKAVIADVEGIIQVCRTAWQVNYKHIHSKAHIQEVIDEYYNTDRVSKEVLDCSRYWNGYWVAESQGQIVGCIGGGLDNERAGHIYVFYVLPKLKRQGIGRALLDELTLYQIDTYAISEQWVSSVTEGNAIGISFYEKVGFVFQYAREHSKDPHLPKSFHYKRSVKDPIER